MTRIFYNGIDPFSGLSPTPLVGRQIEMVRYGDRWGEIENFTLRGEITGKCPTATGLINLQQTLLSGFATDFKTLTIKDGATTVFSRDLVRVIGVNFDQSNYAYLLPYTVNLQAYPSGYFSGYYGVLEPKNTYEFEEREDRSLLLTHTISAKGFNTNSSALDSLQNAKNWVAGHTGLSQAIMPTFVSLLGRSLCLTSLAENINRLAGTYSIRESYTTDLTQSGLGLLRFTVEYGDNINDKASTVAVRGDIQGCPNGSINDVRARFSGFNPYLEALKVYRRVTGLEDLRSGYNSRGVSEDSARMRLGFNFLFDNSLLPRTFFDYKVAFSYDLETDIIEASIDGTVSSTLPLQYQWAAVSALADSLNLYSIVLPLYNTYAASIGINYPLNSLARSYSKIEDSFNYEIKLRSSYENGVIPPLGLSVYEPQISIVPALWQFSDGPILNGLGEYVTTDLNFKNRAQASLTVSAVGSLNQTRSSTETLVKNLMLSLGNQYVTGERKSLDEQSLKGSNAVFGLSVGAASKVSWDEPAFTLP